MALMHEIEGHHLVTAAIIYGQCFSQQNPATVISIFMSGPPSVCDLISHLIIITAMASTVEGSLVAKHSSSIGSVSWQHSQPL